MTIGVIVTGGTIASTRDETGSGLFAPRCGSELLALTEQLGAERGQKVVVERWVNDTGEVMPLLDSCDIDAAHWLMMHRHIESLLNRCQAVVVLHGTDTLAYTASALSMLGPRRKGAVVVTGAQIPLTAEGSDAEANLRLAIDTAAGDLGELQGDTVVAFGGRVMRGVRVTKYSTRDFEGFQSFNSPVLLPATTAGNPAVLGDWQRQRVQAGPSLTQFAPRVLVLRVVPGMDVDWLAKMILAVPPAGLVLELFGVGSAPEADKLASLANELANREVPVVAVSACDHGGLDWNRYEATAPLGTSAMIPGGDMRTEAAVVKLRGLLSDTVANEEHRNSFQQRFQASIAGELST